MVEQCNIILDDLNENWFSNVNDIAMPEITPMPNEITMPETPFNEPFNNPEDIPFKVP
jgi:hypothetical protein